MAEILGSLHQKHCIGWGGKREVLSPSFREDEIGQSFLSRASFGCDLVQSGTYPSATNKTKERKRLVSEGFMVLRRR